MARIRHIAIYADDPEKEASFYCKAFDLKEVSKSQNGAVFLSDGYISLALLKTRGEKTPKGINHFGFQVDNLESTKNHLRKINPDVDIVQQGGGIFAECKIKDPEDNTFDISEKGWAV